MLHLAVATSQEYNKIGAVHHCISDMCKSAGRNGNEDVSEVTLQRNLIGRDAFPKVGLYSPR